MRFMEPQAAPVAMSLTPVLMSMSCRNVSVLLGSHQVMRYVSFTDGRVSA